MKVSWHAWKQTAHLRIRPNVWYEEECPELRQQLEAVRSFRLRLDSTADREVGSWCMRYHLEAWKTMRDERDVSELTMAYQKFWLLKEVRNMKYQERTWKYFGHTPHQIILILHHDDRAILESNAVHWCRLCNLPSLKALVLNLGGANPFYASISFILIPEPCFVP